jgi:hypothetical protein
MQTHCHSFPKLIVYYMAGICGFGLRNIRTQAWREHWTSSQVRMGSSSFASPSWNVFYSKRVVYGLLAVPPSGAPSKGPTPFSNDQQWQWPQERVMRMIKSAKAKNASLCAVECVTIPVRCWKGRSAQSQAMQKWDEARWATIWNDSSLCRSCGKRVEWRQLAKGGFMSSKRFWRLVPLET